MACNPSLSLLTLEFGESSSRERPETCKPHETVHIFSPYNIEVAKQMLRGPM